MTRAKPYTDAEIAERRTRPMLWQSVAEGSPMLPFPIRDDSRWLATVDALQSRLAAAEAAVAVRDALLLECRSRVEMVAEQRWYVSARSCDKDLLARIDTTLRGDATSAKEANRG